MSEHAPDRETRREESTWPQLAPDSTESTLTSEVSQQCTKIIEDFRLGRKDKISAMLDIQASIPHESLIDASFRSALKSYYQVLESFENFRDRSVRDQSNRIRLSSDLADPDADSISEHPALGRVQALTPEPTKRAHSVGSDEEEHPSKKRVDVSQFPWIGTEPSLPSADEFSLRATRAALENFARDLKFSKSSVVNSLTCPQFPESEWTNLLSGRAVDLDHVLSSLFTVTQDEKKTERLGELEIAVGSTSPAKTVKTHGEWITAWDPTVEATVYVFPHRENELKRYGKYILQLFSALPVEAHSRIINFDKAVRVRVAQRRDLTLSDTNQFVDLQFHWIQSVGSLPASCFSRDRRPEQSADKTSRRDPCRRWNEGRCPNTNSACKYKHVCSKCRSNNHTMPECPKT
jgi:hypothetical protein